MGPGNWDLLPRQTVNVTSHYIQSIVPVTNMATLRNLVFHKPNLRTVCPETISPSENLYLYTTTQEIYNTGLYVDLEI